MAQLDSRIKLASCVLDSDKDPDKFVQWARLAVGVCVLAFKPICELTNVRSCDREGTLAWLFMCRVMKLRVMVHVARCAAHRAYGLYVSASVFLSVLTERTR